MRVDDSIFGDLPQPKVKWHARRREILLQPAVSFDEDILHHIGNVDAPLDFLIEPHSHKATHGVAVAVEQSVHRGCSVRLRSLMRSGDQFLRILGVGPHKRYYMPTAIRPPVSSTRTLPPFLDSSMSPSDRSLDERIWSYVRGEAGMEERKKLEAEVSSDPVAARRYATIKLLYQRENARSGPSASPAAPPKPAHRDAAQPSLHNTALANDKLTGLALLAASLLIAALAVGLYFAHTPWSIEQRVLARDGVMFGAAMIGVIQFALARRIKPAPFAATACLAAIACAAAAMYLR